MAIFGDKEIERIICSCGGNAIEKPVDKKEKEQFSFHNRCLYRIIAFECISCKAKFTFALKEPDYDMWVKNGGLSYARHRSKEAW